MIASFPDRRFQLWEYRVSHGCLLVRSPRGPEINTNIDIIFVGVEFLSVPRLMRGLDLDLPDTVDMKRISAEVGFEGDPDKTFVLISGGHRNWVVASAFRMSEHDQDIFSSPFDDTA